MRLNKLDLNLLVVLDMLLRERSVSQTAQIMNLTQPAISSALARLRSYFHDELLVQVDRRMVPTPFAAGLADPVRNVLDDLMRIATARSDFEPKLAERTFKFICSDYSYQVLLTSVIRQLTSVAPGVRITATLTNERNIDLLNQGKVDFIVLPMSRVTADHPTAPLFSEGFSCIAWSGNSVVGNSITREKYLELEHVSTCLGPSSPPTVEQESLDAQGISRKIVVYAPNFSSVPDTIIGTNYIATVHSRIAQLYARRMPIRVFPTPVEIAEFTEVLQWHKSNSADPGIIWMKDFLVHCAAAAGAGGRLPRALEELAHNV